VSGDATGGAGGSGDCGCKPHGGDGGDAASGDAYGGDVSQWQNASNSNETSQKAWAASQAFQWARNFVGTGGGDGGTR
jgi:hypothetical protein